MRVWIGFFIGVAVGAAIGIGSVSDTIDPAGPADGNGDSADHSACRAVEESLRAEIETLRARLEPVPEAAIEGEAAPVPPGEAGGEEAAAAPSPDEDPRAAFRKALDKVRGQLRSIQDAEPGSAAVLALVKEWREDATGEDEMLADLGGRALVYLAGAGKLRPEDVDAVAVEFTTLQPGSPGRAGLAATVARAYGRGPRLAQWFAGLPAMKEPEVRAAVVEALDESPSDAYREYLLKLSRSERDPDVLEATWHEDPITVAMTVEWAPLLIAAIEPRVAEGDLPPVVRGRAVFAIGLASVHEAARASAAIGRLLAAETDEGVLAYGRDVIASIGREEANVQSLDALWAKHRRSFGEK